MHIRDSIRDIVEAIKEAGKGNYVSEATIQSRLKTCEDCGNFSVTPIVEIRYCNECGCNIDIKAMFKKMECPMGKWHGEE